MRAQVPTDCQRDRRLNTEGPQGAKRKQRTQEFRIQPTHACTRLSPMGGGRKKLPLSLFSERIKTAIFASSISSSANSHRVPARTFRPGFSEGAVGLRAQNPPYTHEGDLKPYEDNPPWYRLAAEAKRLVAKLAEAPKSAELATERPAHPPVLPPIHFSERGHVLSAGERASPVICITQVAEYCLPRSPSAHLSAREQIPGAVPRLPRWAGYPGARPATVSVGAGSRGGGAHKFND